MDFYFYSGVRFHSTLVLGDLEVIYGSWFFQRIIKIEVDFVLYFNDSGTFFVYINVTEIYSVVNCVVQWGVCGVSKVNRVVQNVTYAFYRMELIIKGTFYLKFLENSGKWLIRGNFVKNVNF